MANGIISGKISFLKDWRFWVVFSPVLVKLAIHFSYNHELPLMGDEMYYAETGLDLQLGYYIHGFFWPLVAKVSLLIFGPTLFGIRFFPALIGTAVVWLAGRVAKKLGAGTFGQFLASLAVLIAPANLNLHQSFAVSNFFPLFNILFILFLVDRIKNNKPNAWLWIGFFYGLALSVKLTVLLYLPGMAVAMLVTPLRKDLKLPQFWGAVVITSIVLSPFIYWQATHDWTVFAYLVNENADSYSKNTMIEVVILQFLSAYPTNFPIWLAGIFSVFFLKEFKPYAVFSWVFILAAMIVVVFGGKQFYLDTMFPMLFAMGAVVIERLMVDTGLIRKKAIVAVILFVMIASGVVAVLTSCPVLEEEKRKQFLLSFFEPMKNLVPPERRFDAFANVYPMRFPYKHMLKSLKKKQDNIKPKFDPQSSIMILRNYRLASASNLFGKKLGLPRATSYDGALYYRPIDLTNVKDVIFAGENSSVIDEYFKDVKYLGKLEEAPAGIRLNIMGKNLSLANTNRKNIDSVYLCRSPKASMEEIWQKIGPVYY